jgi:ABC-type lipoprotein export system ATPase subunit
MTLTVCVGASGSGKTTFLNDVHKSHKCTYIRQYHNLRPYIKVSKIPDFDPTRLPYWDIYVNENKASSVIVGGTIAGQFMPGLSGGQRKLLLFELIFQRTAEQENLLIVLDEPFAGVTDDFVPFIVSRLNEMRKYHNILLVTNDHVDTLKKMADNTVTVSAIDRSKVKINDMEGVDRELALLAMVIGDDYHQKRSDGDLKFFVDVEFSKNGGIPFIAGFGVFAFGLFLLMFWDSQPGSEALVLVAAGIISFFIANPYFLQLTDWRIFMVEEAEALLHSSKEMNRFLKLCLAIGLLVIISSIQFSCQNLIIDTLNSTYFYFAILFDNISLMVAILCLGLYTDLPDQAVQIIGSMPFLFMIFFSTTFSPGAGVSGLKELRYLFSRFYLWCETPGVMDTMEGCTEEKNLFYLIVSSLLIPFIFVAFMVVRRIFRKVHSEKAAISRRESMKSMAFAELQFELFGEKALKKLQHLGSAADLQKLASSSEADSSVGTSLYHEDSDGEEC